LRATYSGARRWGPDPTRARELAQSAREDLRDAQGGRGRPRNRCVGSTHLGGRCKRRLAGAL